MLKKGIREVCLYVHAWLSTEPILVCKHKLLTGVLCIASYTKCLWHVIKKFVYSGSEEEFDQIDD